MLQRTCITGKSGFTLKGRFCRFFVIVFASVVLFGFGNVPAAEGQDAPKASAEILAKAKAVGNVRIIVRLKTPFQPEGWLSDRKVVTGQQNRISKLQTQLQETMSKHQARVVNQFKHIPYTVMEVDGAALAALMANPLVTSIEEDVPVPPTLIGSVPLIRADQAWAEGYTGAGWTVAILDTGVDKTHSFIGANKVVAEACFSTTTIGFIGSDSSKTVCPNGLDFQVGSGAGVNCTIKGCDHGTHVAGIAAGKEGTYNSLIYNGVAKDANIIAIQVFSQFTDMANCDDNPPCVLTWSSDQIAALEHVYSLRNTYNIAAVNMSFGGGEYTSNCDSTETARKAAIDTLRSVGIATIISSGNDSYPDAIGSPACISTAVSVGATNKSDVEAAYSNYHPTMLSLFAPGSSITSSVPGGGWAAWNGTSMAVPHVTGAWAILKQKSPLASVTDLLNNLQATGATVTLKAGDMPGGMVKRIDVRAALDVASDAPEPPTGLSGSALSASAITLNWTDNSSDETGFKIERKTGASGVFSQIGAVGAGVTTYLDSGLNDGTAYYYRVLAYNASSNSPFSNEASAVTWLLAPSGLSALGVSASAINLTWTDNSSAETGFKIERKTEESGIYGQIATVAANITQYSDSGLTAATTYYYRIRAYNADTNSDYSSESSATTSASDPDDGGGGGGGGGCFIATAAFGTPLEEHVQILRDFRDRCLLTSSAGKAFVKFYYDVSPPIAARISQNDGLRFMTRCSLMPLVGMAYLMVTYGITATLLFLMSLILMTGALIWAIRRRMMVIKQ